MGSSSDEFLWAIKNGDLESVKKYVENQGVGVVDAELMHRFPLQFAADYGQAEVIQYLVSIGAKVNRVDKNNMTALLCAIYENHVHCVELLLKMGADKSLKAPSGESYLECAESDEIKVLLQN